MAYIGKKDGERNRGSWAKRRVREVTIHLLGRRGGGRVWKILIVLQKNF